MGSRMSSRNQQSEEISSAAAEFGSSGIPAAEIKQLRRNQQHQHQQTQHPPAASAPHYLPKVQRTRYSAGTPILPGPFQHAHPPAAPAPCRPPTPPAGPPRPWLPKLRRGPGPPATGGLHEAPPAVSLPAGFAWSVVAVERACCELPPPVELAASAAAELAASDLRGTRRRGRRAGGAPCVDVVCRPAPWLQAPG